MKKITALFFLFVILSLNSKKTEEVFNETNDIINKPNMYLLSEFKPEITTKNIKKYFSNNTYEIIPYINPIYKNKIYYEFNKYIVNNNLEEVLENYIYDYDNILEKYTINNDKTNYQINGYPIDSIIVNDINSINNLQYKKQIIQ